VVRLAPTPTKMFGFLNKKSKLEKLEARHAKLLEEAFALSKSNRGAADAKTAEAAALDQEIAKLRQAGS